MSFWELIIAYRNGGQNGPLSAKFDSPDSTSSYATGHHALLSAYKTSTRKYAVKLLGIAF